MMTPQRPPGTTDLDFIELTQLPYLTACPLGGRRIVLLAHHDGSRFSTFIPQQDGSLMVVNPIDMAGGHYFARAPAHVDDVPTNLYSVVIQHYSYPKPLDLVQRMHADIVNALASVHRYFVMLEYANRFSDLATMQMVATELEYAFGNHRAFYDLLNRFITLFRFEPQYSASVLPDSFRKTLQKPDKELATRFGLPAAILSVIRARQANFFRLREIRDAIFHQGKSVTDIVFHLDDGFAVSAESDLLATLHDLNIWSPSLLRTNRLASLLPLLAFMVRDLTETADLIAQAILEAVSPPDPIAIGQAVFFRSSLTRHIRNLDRYEREHWLAPDQVLDLKERKQVAGR
jgi:hypothetical protein